MLAVQYTFFASIEKGNAAAAAILQYLAPFFVLFYLYVKKELPPKWKDAVLNVRKVKPKRRKQKRNSGPSDEHTPSRNRQSTERLN